MWSVPTPSVENNPQVSSQASSLVLVNGNRPLGLQIIVGPVIVNPTNPPTYRPNAIFFFKKVDV